MDNVVKFEEKQKLNTQQTDFSKLTDLANSKRFIECADGKLHFLIERSKWLYFKNGNHWTVDESGKIAAAVSERVIKKIYQEAAAESNPKVRMELGDFARQSESEYRIKSMQRLAAPFLSISIDELDRNPMLLNCLNGTIDLKTGKLKKHDQDDFISKIILTEYDPSADCPEWNKFLEMIMGNDQELVKFLQQMVGYCLTGHTDERAIFIAEGSGKNGKSTFTENIAYLLSGYAMKAGAETLLLKRFGEGIPNDIARLKGARFVYVTETEKGRRFAESKIKELTGDKDTVIARFLHREYFEYIPEFKLFLSTNHLPTITGVDDAIWDRIKRIPFNVRIPDKAVKPRREVDKIFESEREGILAWAIRGCLEWQKHGLITPTAVQKASSSYREESDALKPFLDEYCHAKKGNNTEKSKLYEAYLKWTQENGEKPLTKIKFGTELKNRNFKDFRSTSAGRKSFWKNIKLRKPLVPGQN